MSANSGSSRNFIPMSSKYDRIILLVDMDCFYCQVEEKLDPSLKGQPLAVVQYNAWKGGGIIAVNYAARAKGVTRHMRGDEAKEQCPDIQLVKVPNVREKADLTKYREAGKDVANVLQRFTPLLERASVDEAYLDITESVNKRLVAMNDGSFVLQPQELINTYAVGFPTIGDYVTTITTGYINPLLDNDDFYRNFQEADIPAVRQSNIRLLIGASIASEIRAAVKTETGYECSAGIAHNKILAKLACGINKPNKQTLLPLTQIERLFETLPIGKIKGLGAKFGEEICERMNIRYLGQLLKFTESELQRKFDEKNGTWLYNICRGIDLEAVTPRFYSKSIGCCKKFPGRNNITGIKTLQHWLKELANEISERLEKDIVENNRRAKQMVVNFIQEFNSEEISSSRSAPLSCYDREVLSKTSLDIIKANTKQFFRSGSESILNNPIKFLGISVGKFESISNSQNNIQDMFAQQAAKKKRLSDEQKLVSSDNDIVNDVESSISTNKQADKLDKKDATTQKKRHDVKSFFANALKKQMDSSPSELLSNVVPNDLRYMAKESIPDDVCYETAVAHDGIQHPEPNEDFITPNRKVIVPQLASKSFFKIRLKKEDQNTSQGSLENSNTAFDIGDQRKINDNILENNMDNEVFSFVNKDHVSQTNGQTLEHFDENDGTELHALINDLQSMQGEIEHENKVELQNESPSTAVNNKRKFDELSHDSECKPTNDYRSEYAEFALPTFRPEFFQYTNCATCGAKILSDPMSVQTHKDHHFALELSQQQRQEFRQEILAKVSTTKSSPNHGNKKVKQTSTNPNKKIPNGGIAKFLKPPSAAVVPHNTQPCNSLLETCDICGVSLKREELSEHKDFHMAKELQRQLNQLEVHTVDIGKKAISGTSRRNLNASMSTQPGQSKLTAKPITQFFTQSNT